MELGHGRFEMHQVELQKIETVHAARGRSRRSVFFAATMLARLHTDADVRRNRVAKLRASTTAGMYENDLKLAVAVDRLLEALRE